MSAVKISIGATSGSLTQLNKTIDGSGPLAIGRQEQTKNKVTYHGHRDVAVLGQRKRVWGCKFKYVTSGVYANFASYALSSRRWWVQIPGHSGYYIFNNWAYVQFNNESIEIVSDTETYYNFEFLVFEL